jgi:hypothetical protein
MKMAPLTLNRVVWRRGHFLLFFRANQMNEKAHAPITAPLFFNDTIRSHGRCFRWQIVFLRFHQTFSLLETVASHQRPSVSGFSEKRAPTCRFDFLKMLPDGPVSVIVRFDVNSFKLSVVHRIRGGSISMF